MLFKHLRPTVVVDINIKKIDGITTARIWQNLAEVAGEQYTGPWVDRPESL